MLDRVTIASLGDLVQPFTNSSNWLTWLKALSRTSLTAKGETGVAKNLGIAHNNEIRASLQKPLAIKGDEISANASWLGNDKLSLTAANNLFFRISGLEWLTGFARRFAYNAGAVDAYTTANKLSKFVSKGGKLNSSKGSKLVTDLERYGVTATDALKIGSKSYDDIVKTAIGKKNLNEAGIAAANRDAIIPQVSNRLLFTQSNAPWVRLMGQFLSWSMAKSAQTNKILSRIENGDVRTMVKLVAALPVYGGIQELRELAKYGEVVTDINTDADEWWSEAIRLSGLPGVGPEFVASNLVGPGSRQPFFLAFPAGSILYESDKILKDYFKGNTERANERFFQRIAPLPNWRNFILERAKDLGVDLDDGGRKLPESKLERKTFSEGDEVTNNMNLKKVATGMIAAKIATSGVNADMLNTPIETPIQEKKETIVPIEKSNVKYELPKNIDMDFLKEVEGDKNIMYVPTSKNKKVVGNSGATIGMGFDLGARDINDLKGLPPEIITKLKPYLGLKKEEALQFVKDNPLRINEKEKNIINAFAKKEAVENLQKEWKETTGKSFDTLPTEAATAITSVAFQHGKLSNAAPNFWKQITNDDWSGAFANLLDWDGTGKPSQTQSRREKEAKLLKGLFKNNKEK
jgi:GH24 family phage-related lysozyme (muramidase)